MADVNKSSGQDGQVTLGKLISEVFDSLLRIDVGAEEAGVGFPLDTKLIVGIHSLDTLACAVWSATRHHLKSTPSADLSNFEVWMGRPGSKKLLRKVLRAMLYRSHIQGMTKYQVGVRLAADGQLYKSFSAWLPQAMAHVAKTDQVGGVKLTVPTLTFRPIGEAPVEPGEIRDNRTRGGHNQKIIEEAKKRVLALEAPKTT